MKSTLDFMLADERMHHFLNRIMEESAEFRNRLYDFSHMTITGPSMNIYIRLLNRVRLTAVILPN